MKTHQHYLASRKDNNTRLTSLMAAIVPDIFIVLRNILPNEKAKSFCSMIHHSPQGLALVDSLNHTLGTAFYLHYEQDKVSHDFKYHSAEGWNMPKDSVMLFSGGLDSFIIWRLLGQPRAVYFDIGHKAAKREGKAIRAINKAFNGNIEISKALDLRHNELDSGYIPYRNLLFIMLASYLEPNVIIGQICEYAPDKNKKFYRHSKKLLNSISKGKFQGLDGRKVNVYTPYISFTKTQLVAKYLQTFPTWDVKGNTDLMKYTVSCYGSEQKFCGVCNACVSRFIAMENNGQNEQAKYKQLPDVKYLKNRLNWRDFKLSQVKMYYKRWREIKQFTG